MAIIYGRPDSERRLLNNYPTEIKITNGVPKVYEKFKEPINEKDTGFFTFVRKWNKKKQLNKFVANGDDRPSDGAGGKNKVLSLLVELSDDYHVFCDVCIVLPFTVRYGGQLNLRTVQIDFVVVSRKGVFLIDVKNWRNEAVNNHGRFSPYEQTDRAGRALWIALKSIVSDIRVTNVLLSIGDNIAYNQNYMTVFVSSPEQINKFLKDRQYVMTEREVGMIIRSLRYYVRRQ